MPPVVMAPCFSIRKGAVAVFTLDDYVAAGTMTQAQADALAYAVSARMNIVVAGGKRMPNLIPKTCALIMSLRAITRIGVQPASLMMAKRYSSSFRGSWLSRKHHRSL